jgi:hypothetical protein
MFFNLKGELTMKSRLFLFIGIPVVMLLALPTLALTGFNLPQLNGQPAANLVQTVRQAADPYKDVAAAEAAGYGLFMGCVSGPQEGAMGVHYPKGALVGDGALDPMQPEALIYEPTSNGLKLAAVEFIVLADDWNANHPSPPALMGQVFNLVGSPNRYGLPAFYELHVWAWKNNPNGVFADWNPLVTCEEFNMEASASTSTH